MSHLKLRSFSLTAIFFLLIGSGLTLYSGNQYPGGSIYDTGSTGFSLTENYWCHLFSPVALNGLPHNYYQYAIAGGFLLSISFLLTFLVLPYYTNSSYKNISLGTGTLSMLLAPFIYTEYHDIIIVISGILGSIALIPVFKELIFKNLFNLLFCSFGLLCCAFTYYIYKSGFCLHWLPLLQKMSVLILVAWQVHCHFLMLRA